MTRLSRLFFNFYRSPKKSNASDIQLAKFNSFSELFQQSYN